MDTKKVNFERPEFVQHTQEEIRKAYEDKNDNIMYQTVVINSWQIKTKR